MTPSHSTSLTPSAALRAAGALPANGLAKQSHTVKDVYALPFFAAIGAAGSVVDFGILLPRRAASSPSSRASRLLLPCRPQVCERRPIPGTGSEHGSPEGQGPSRMGGMASDAPHLPIFSDFL